MRNPVYRISFGSVLMLRPSVLSAVLLLGPAALLCTGASCASAQTLQQRPQAQPATPSAESLPPVNPVILSGTGLQVEAIRNYPMKSGEAIQARLLAPIYINGRLAVPQGAVLSGKVAALDADTHMRWRGRLRGDFTPFHTARVEFDHLVLPNGSLSISTAGTVIGAPVVHLSSTAAHHGGFIARQWTRAKNKLHDSIAVFTAPGKGDRALQALYHQLPYHPERIPAHTAWSLELAAPVTLPIDQLQAENATAPPSSKPGQPETWSVHAALNTALTSANAKPGDAVQATVVEPVFDKDRQLVVPQGSVLVGKVTAARAARALGRNGKLRFTFQQVRFPEGQGTPVQGALAGATTGSAQSLSLDAEGTVTPRNQTSAIAPLLLTLLAGRALDDDGNLTVQTGVASNGFGLVGRIVGTVAGDRRLAAGIGFYAAGLSFYESFLRPGSDVVFPRDTRIEIETTPLRAPVLKPNGD